MSASHLRGALVVSILFGTTPALATAPTKAQCIAANEDAQKLRDGRKLRDARAQLLVCVDTKCPGPVRDDCTGRLAEIDKAIPTLVFDVKDGSGNDLAAVAVTVDGEPLVTKLDGSALPVDPGERVFRFSADGLPTVEKKLVVREGDKDRRVRVVLRDGSAPTSASEAGSTQRTIGIVAGGAGVVGLVVGSIFGIVANQDYQSGKSTCSAPPNGCTPAGVTEGNADAPKNATAATVAFIVGGTLVAGGVALYFTAPRDAGIVVGPTAFVGGGGLGVRGTW